MLSIILLNNLDLFCCVFLQDFEGQVTVSTSWDSDRPSDSDHIPLYVLWNVPGTLYSFVLLYDYVVFTCLCVNIQ